MGLIKKTISEVRNEQTEEEKFLEELNEKRRVKKEWNEWKSKYGTMDEVNHERARKNLPSSMR